MSNKNIAISCLVCGVTLEFGLDEDQYDLLEAMRWHGQVCPRCLVDGKMHKIYVDVVPTHETPDGVDALVEVKKALRCLTDDLFLAVDVCD